MTRALGRYELVRPLARGGMAEVFLARRRAAGVEKWLVVKRIRPERANDARFLELFVREARLSMSLVHQNIVPVFDFGRSADQVFIAMERVEGKDLGSSLAKGKPLPPLVAAFVAAECCQALAYAHHRKAPDGSALGIVHRDVTPRNVLLSWSGEVKLTDFGIASLAGDPDEAARTIGTPAYMAPEQARADKVDHRADVYALGLVLREALTGVRARPSGEREATLAMARAGDLAAWPDVEVPAALRAIADRATDALPEARFADAHEMLVELDSYIVGERAARKADAPARQLAGWLAETWGSERDEPADDAVEAGDMVSFLDDANLDVIGTGTQRSMLATAADEPPPVDQAPRAAGSNVMPVPDAAASAAIEARRTRGVVVVMIGLAVVGIGAMVVREYVEHVHENKLAFDPDVDDDDENPDIASRSIGDPEAVPPDAADTGSDGSAKPGSAATGSATGSAGSNANVRPPDNHVHTVITHPPDAHLADPPAPKPTHKVLINSTPWSYFTIDGDPTSHQTPETVELSPGPHVVHFSNPQLHLEANASVDVPADHDIRFSQTLK